MKQPDICTSCGDANLSPWENSMTARKCGNCKMVHEKSTGQFHVDCPCWATGKFVWVAGCDGHPRESAT